MKTTQIYLGAFLAAILALVSCKQHRNAETQEQVSEGAYGGTIKIGHLIALDMAPMFIAKEKGFFEEEDLEVETVFFANPGDNNTALAGGSIQFSINPFTLPYFGVNSGIPMKIISAAGGIGVIEVIIQGDVGPNNIQELVSWIRNHPNEKLKIAVLKGDTLEMIIYKMLQDNGLSYDDVEMVWFNDLLAMVQAFQTKQVDILSHIKPYTSNMILNYGAKSITTNQEVWGYGTPNCTVAILDEFAYKYPETVKAYLRAIEKGFTFIVNNPDEASRILDEGNYYKVSQEVLSYAFRNQPKEVVLNPDQNGIMTAINDMVSQGYITQPDRNIIDTQYLDALGIR